MLERKPWQPLEAATVAKVPGTLGVYQLADADGNVLYIGVANAREPFGLRGRLLRHVDPAAETNPVIRERATAFRYEVNLQYTTRWIELLDGFLAQHGQLPLGNVAAPEELPPSVRRRLTARR